jgi:hypothetical protein
MYVGSLCIPQLACQNRVQSGLTPSSNFSIQVLQLTLQQTTNLVLFVNGLVNLSQLGKHMEICLY